VMGSREREKAGINKVSARYNVFSDLDKHIK